MASIDLHKAWLDVPRMFDEFRSLNTYLQMLLGTSHIPHVLSFDPKVATIAAEDVGETGQLISQHNKCICSQGICPYTKSI